MKTVLLTIAAAAAVAATAYGASGGWQSSTTTAAARPIPQNVMWGHVKAFTRKGPRYEMKFDPGWWLTGTAAEHAALEDTGSRDVPNDVYTLEEGHRLLTFSVLESARINVLTAPGEWQRVTPAQFVQIQRGKKSDRPPHLRAQGRLLDPHRREVPERRGDDRPAVPAVTARHAAGQRAGGCAPGRRDLALSNGNLRFPLELPLRYGKTHATSRDVGCGEQARLRREGRERQERGTAGTVVGGKPGSPVGGDARQARFLVFQRHGYACGSP